MPAIFEIKKYLSELLKIKTLSKFLDLSSLISLKKPDIPSWEPVLLFDRSKVIISSMCLSSVNSSLAREFCLTNIDTGVWYFFEMAWI